MHMCLSADEIKSKCNRCSSYVRRADAPKTLAYPVLGRATRSGQQQDIYYPSDYICVHTTEGVVRCKPLDGRSKKPAWCVRATTDRLNVTTYLDLLFDPIHTECHTLMLPQIHVDKNGTRREHLHTKTSSTESTDC